MSTVTDEFDRVYDYHDYERKLLPWSGVLLSTLEKCPRKIVTFSGKQFAAYEGKITILMG